jgi:hypothetical protein
MNNMYGTYFPNLLSLDTNALVDATNKIRTMIDVTCLRTSFMAIGTSDDGENISGAAPSS